ncbi:Uncharacterised protein [Kluyvera cryocrescens]|uniref:Uncharacterized protein n=1 Tax=Kluyvera cryocrescens TaxID=580 RepID=A0A485ASA9_KLUCR|nr:Uncharacterised protein [Kluyvera cryocrescens]
MRLDRLTNKFQLALADASHSHWGKTTNLSNLFI